jgi:autotransporter-associated beta strand protein
MYRTQIVLAEVCKGVRTAVSTLIALVACIASQTPHRSLAATYVYTPQLIYNDPWSTSEYWNSVPVSDASTRLTFVRDNEAAVPYRSDSINDIPGPFSLNILDLQGTGASPVYPYGSMTIRGMSGSDPSWLNFVSNEANTPTVNLNACNGTAPTFYSLVSDVVLADSTTFQGDGTAYFDITGIISGAGSLTKNGASTLALRVSAGNTYSGGTIISNGTLQISNGNALGSGNVINNGTLALYSDGASTFYAPVTSDISGSGSLVVSIYSSNSRATLTGTNTYRGSTTIKSGTLQLSGGSDRLPTTTTVIIGDPSYGCTLDLNSQNQTIASLSGRGSVILGQFNVAGTLTVGDATNTEYSGTISDCGNLVKQGEGTLILSGRNTYTGSTTINAGTLVLEHGYALPGSSQIFLNGGTLATGSGSQWYTPGTLTLGGDAVIDMCGPQGTFLEFANSHLRHWDGTLTVANWCNSFSGEVDSLRFGSSASGLTPAQLDKIVFIHPNGLSGNYRAVMYSSGTVVPGELIVPEPTSAAITVGGGLVLCGLAMRRWRRHAVLARSCSPAVP